MGFPERLSQYLLVFFSERADSEITDKQRFVRELPAKTATYRSLRSLQSAALVPSAGTVHFHKTAFGSWTAGGAILVAIVGFTWGGWMTTSAANKLADQRADTAVVAILTPICVEKFQQNSDSLANLTALKKISSTWEQGNFVEKGGWATRPGAPSPDYILARACAEKLVQAKSAAQ
jgi:hypothetical protein